MAAVRVSFLLCASWACIVAPMAAAQSTPAIAIVAQPMAQALAEFAKQTGLQLVYVSEVVGSHQSTRVPPGLAPADALTRLLENTGLRFEFLNERTIRIYAEPADPLRTSSRTASGAASGIDDRTGSLAVGLGEVFVTATRREELASDVPISMFVWSQEAMEASGIKGMTEIGAMTPGLGFDWRAQIGASVYTSLDLRGVTGRHGVSTGIFIDDTLLPAVWHDTYGRTFPATFDMDRVEILRGAQGMLLGQNTLGGAIRFIPNQPSLTTFSGHASAEWATTAHGDLSYEAGVAAGGPVIDDVLGVRVSGWYRSEGGFVDRIDPLTSTLVDRDANRTVSKSARIGLTWAPSDSVRITPTLTYESVIPMDTASFFMHLSDPDRGEFRNSNLVRQPFDTSFYLASLNLTATFNAMDFAAITSLFNSNSNNLNDLTSGFEDPFGPYPVATVFRVDGKQRVFSQEVRLTAADLDAAFTWLVGALYWHTETRSVAGFTDIAPAEHDTTLIDQDQLEGYAQFSRRIGRRVTVSAGWRIGRASYDYVTKPNAIFQGRADESSVTPRFDVSYRTDRGSLFYLAAAKGYRSGGVVPLLPGCEPPWEFPPDTVWDYEIGVKSDLFGGRAHLEASVFHMRWNNEQRDVVAQECLFGFQRGKAASNGFEMSAQARITERVSFRVDMSYIDARYTQAVESDGVVIVHEGDAVQGARLPWKVTASIGYEFPATRGVTVEVRAEDYFRGGNPGPTLAESPASPFYDPDTGPWPSTNLLNLHANVRWRNLDLRFFVNNALDSRPILNRTAGNGCCTADTVYEAYTFTPRTVGVSATWRF